MDNFLSKISKRDGDTYGAGHTSIKHARDAMHRIIKYFADPSSVSAEPPSIFAELSTEDRNYLAYAHLQIKVINLFKSFG